ncbi:MAG TPA: hypothetical protein VEB40_08010 [Flavipsychrobacter sp.]|nr:hypothetical protein [Flavipsychrobacter sp.]
MPLTKTGAKELARYLYCHTAASQKQITQAVPTITNTNTACSSSGYITKAFL